MFPLQSDKLLEDLLISDGQGIKKNKKTVEKNKDEAQHSKAFKKIMHRDTERQRRHEMADLCASLRSLLPFEYIKGKRSVSDHMDQAVRYIKHMEKRINGMQTKRDQLKKLSNSQSAAIDNCVKINPCRGGMEILITSSLNGEGFSLSKVLADLLVGRGLNVISCISARSVDEVVLHQIQIEVNDPSSINLTELQENLVNVIKFA